MRRATTYVVVVAAAAVLLTGCGRAIREGVGLGRGAKGIRAEIQPVAAAKDARPLGSYSRFELGPMQDDFGGNVPSELLRLLPGEFQKQLAEKELPNQPGGKTLLVRGRILHYEAEGLFGLAFGDFEEVIARVELVDKDTGRTVGTANCIGRTTESVNRGVEKKAEGLAKAIVGWIAERYPTKE